METSPSAERLTSRFIAGNNLERELKVCQNLFAEGTLATLDHLGESVTGTSVIESTGSLLSSAALRTAASLGPS